MTTPLPEKVAIVGAGLVGATIAYACLLRGVAKRIALYDVNGPKAQTEAMDLSHGLQFLPGARVEGGDDVDVCRDAAVVVMAAGAEANGEQTRGERASANVGTCRTVLPGVLRVAPEATVVVATNPVDVVTYGAMKISGLPLRRVLGVGTVVESARFRSLIAERLKVAVGSVQAFIAGEHGGGEVPLWSSASVANVPLSAWAVQGHGRLTVRDRVEIFEGAKGNGASSFAMGVGVAEIVGAILQDEGRVLTVSSWQEAFGVCLSLPSIVNRRGVDGVLSTPMNENERAGLGAAAEAIRGVMGGVGV